jgi:taurine dioxygenase
MTNVSTTSALDSRPIGGLLGTEIRGVDLSAPLSAESVDAIRAELTAHGVVVFPNQHAGPEHHRALAESLGEIKFPADYLESLRDQGYPEITVISTDNGFAYLTDQWHADVTWMVNPPRYSILHMQIVPPAGGDTLWSSQYAAYDYLSEPMKQFLEPLTVRHQLPGMPDRFADHPVVCVNPISGRKALFVNKVFSTKINELQQEESDAVLAYLVAHSVRPEFICRWRWHEGDVAIWDNHYVQHYAVADYRPHARKIHRIEIEGEPLVGARD